MWGYSTFRMVWNFPHIFLRFFRSIQNVWGIVFSIWKLYINRVVKPKNTIYLTNENPTWFDQLVASLHLTATLYAIYCKLNYFSKAPDPPYPTTTRTHTHSHTHTHAHTDNANIAPKWECRANPTSPLATIYDNRVANRSQKPRACVCVCAMTVHKSAVLSCVHRLLHESPNICCTYARFMFSVCFSAICSANRPPICAAHWRIVVSWIQIICTMCLTKKIKRNTRQTKLTQLSHSSAAECV